MKVIFFFLLTLLSIVTADLGALEVCDFYRLPGLSARQAEFLMAKREFLERILLGSEEGGDLLPDEEIAIGDAFDLWVLARSQDGFYQLSWKQWRDSMMEGVAGLYPNANLEQARKWADELVNIRNMRVVIKVSMEADVSQESLRAELTKSSRNGNLLQLLRKIESKSGLAKSFQQFSVHPIAFQDDPRNLLDDQSVVDRGKRDSDGFLRGLKGLARRQYSANSKKKTHYFLLKFEDLPDDAMLLFGNQDGVFGRPSHEIRRFWEAYARSGKTKDPEDILEFIDQWTELDSAAQLARRRGPHGSNRGIHAIWKSVFLSLVEGATAPLKLGPPRLRDPDRVQGISVVLPSDGFTFSQLEHLGI